MIDWYLKSINSLKSFQSFNEKDYAINITEEPYFCDTSKAENYLIKFFNNTRRFLYSIWLFFFRELQLENERDYNRNVGKETYLFDWDKDK
jgi:hypothetical protein